MEYFWMVIILLSVLGVKDIIVASINKHKSKFTKQSDVFSFYTTQIDFLTNRVNSLQSQLETTQNELSKANKVVEQLKSDLDKANNKIELLETKVKDYKQAFDE